MSWKEVKEKIYGIDVYDTNEYFIADALQSLVTWIDENMIVPPKESKPFDAPRKTFYGEVKYKPHSDSLPRTIKEDECVPSVAIISEFKHLPPSRTCPNCGSMRYRIVYTDDEMTEVKFYDCLMCRHSWC